MGTERRPSVSLTMIVRDSASTLDRCLASIEGILDEWIIVDTGSKDGTQDVARQRGAHLVEMTWPDSFALARNEALTHATGDWIVWLDADEWLDAQNALRLRTLVQSLHDLPHVYFMEQRSPIGSTAISVVQPRLFRRLPAVQWVHRVHEQILPACLARGDRPTATDIVIHHDGYVSSADAASKRERNLRLIEAEYRARPDDPWVAFQLAQALIETRPTEAESLLARTLASIQENDPLERALASAWARSIRLQDRWDDPAVLRRVRDWLRRYPNDTELLSTLGTLSYQRGDLESAAQAFDALRASQPDDAEWFVSVDRSLRSAQATHNLASVRVRQGRLAEAEALWRSLLDVNPRDVSSSIGLAEVLLTERRFAEFDAILAPLEARSSREQRDLDMLTARGQLERREFASAVEQLQRLIRENRDDLAAHLLLARAHLLGGGDLDAAEDALCEALRIDPTHAEARRCLDALRELE
ncbi:MAG: glycosyltransferase [Isosphaeraceae bacterium]